MESSGAIRARRVRELAQAAHDKGVGWPSSLFALLDDIIARDGTMEVALNLIIDAISRFRASVII